MVPVVRFRLDVTKVEDSNRSQVLISINDEDKIHQLKYPEN